MAGLQRHAPYFHAAFISLLLAIFSAGPVRAQEWMLEMAGKDVMEELKAVFPEHVLFMAGTVGTSLTYAPLDESITRRLVGARSPEPLATYLDVTNELGGRRMLVPVAGVFVASLATRDRRFQEAALTSLESVLFAGGVSYGIKYVLGRRRPDESEAPFHFDPFSGSTSFPSGHATMVFATLTPWVLYYPHPVTYAVAAVGAGGTALARVVKGRHWTTDVLAGASIGTYTAWRLTRRHQGREGEGITAIVPTMGPQGPGLYASWKF